MKNIIKQIVLEGKSFQAPEEVIRTMDLDFTVEEPMIVRSDEYDVYPLEDGVEELMEIATRCVKDKYHALPKALIRGLCNEKTLSALVKNSEPIWVAVDEVNEFFLIAQRERTRGAFAWYLSQPPGSQHYHGQWFEKRGYFVRKRNEEGGERKISMSKSSLPRFKTREYRISLDAIEVIRWLMSEGFKSESY
ncbi:MAG: hypothetical protein ACXAEN_18805 [Candidatus Thorarchaeota archaeon]